MKLTHPSGVASLALLLLAGAATCARGQATEPIMTGPPAYPGFRVPKVAGVLNSSISASERITPNFNGGSALYSTDITGNVGFATPSVEAPFSLIGSAGYLTSSSSSQPASFFTNLTMSQTYTTRNWKFLASDAVNYLPSSPVSGLSGIAGLGDLGADPTQLLGESGSVQTTYAPRVKNTASGSVTRTLSGRTSVTASGSTGLQRFVGNVVGGIDDDQLTASSGVQHDFSGRESMTVSYSYTRQSYPQYDISYNSQGASVQYAKQWTRQLKTQFAAGPQYTTSVGKPGGLNYTVNGNADYTLQSGQLTAEFIRAVNTGSGATLATRSNTARVNATHKITQFTSGSAFVSYLNSNTLPSTLAAQFSINTFIASVQVTQSISRYISAYVSYSAQHQSSVQSALAVNTLNGLMNTVGFGVTYTPKSLTLGRQ